MTGCGGPDRPELPTSPPDPPPGSTPAGCPAGKRGLPSDSPILLAWPGGPAIRFGRESSTLRRSTRTSAFPEVFPHSSSPTGSSTTWPYFLHRKRPELHRNPPVPVDRRTAGYGDRRARTPHRFVGSDRRSPARDLDPPRPVAHRRLRMAPGQGRPRGDRLPRGRERPHPGPHGAPGRPAAADLRRDQVPHPRDRPVGADPGPRLLVLRALLRGPAVRRQLPRARRRPRQLGSPAPGRGRATRRAGAAGRGDAARPRRARGRPRVLLPRRLLDQPRRPAPRLRDRRGRRRALHRAGEGPDHGRPARRRADRRPGRRHMGRDSRPLLLLDRRRDLALRQGLAPPPRHRAGRRRPGLPRAGRPVLGRRRPHPQPALRRRSPPRPGTPPSTTSSTPPTRPRSRGASPSARRGSSTPSSTP